MAIFIPTKTRYSSATTGVRPVDAARDSGTIVTLIEMGFGAELDPQGLKMLAQMKRTARLMSWPPILPISSLEPTGFVYEEKGQVVGNLSLRYAQPRRSMGRLIGNVVVHPDYRDKGIGRALVKTAIEKARSQAARWIGLEVRADNVVACGLYENFGFVSVGRTHHLVRPGGLPWSKSVPPQHPWKLCSPKDSKVWNTLANAVYGYQQKRILEIRPGLYAFGGLERRISLWLSQQIERAWLCNSEQPQLALWIKTERRHRFHVWEMLLHPDFVVSGAQEVAAKALHAVRRFPSWPVVALVADQEPLLQTLYNIGFKPHRTLLQMILEL